MHPNILTLLSLFSSILFFLLLTNDYYIAAFLALIGSVFDVIDGHVARTRGKVSVFGGFFDSVCDRVSDFFIFSAFGYAGLVSWGVVAPAFFTSFMVSYIRARGEVVFKGEKKLDKGILQRTGRFFVVFVGFLLYFFLPNFRIGSMNIFTDVMVLITVLNSITIVQRMSAVQTQSREKV